MRVKCINAKGIKYLKVGDIFTIKQFGSEVYYIEELDKDLLKTRFVVLEE